MTINFTLDRYTAPEYEFVRRYLGKNVILYGEESEWSGRLGNSLENIGLMGGEIDAISVAFTPNAGSDSNPPDYIWNDVYAAVYRTGWRMSLNEDLIEEIVLK